MKSSLAELMSNPLLWRGDQFAPVIDTVASGYPELDDELPGAGWPQGAVTELLLDHKGIGELRLLLPAMQRLHEAGDLVVFISPPHVPHPLALAAAALDPKRIVVIRSAGGNDGWWAAEQILRSNAAAALLFWPPAVDDRRLRRLQLAAEGAKCLSFVFTRSSWSAHASPSPLRLELQPTEHHTGDQLRVHIKKRRGGIATHAIVLTLSTVLGKTVPTAASAARSKLINMRAMPRKSSARFNKSYPVGPAHPRVWNRALNPTDEVRRPPSPDRRGISR